MVITSTKKQLMNRILPTCHFLVLLSQTPFIAFYVSSKSMYFIQLNLEIYQLQF